MADNWVVVLDDETYVETEEEASETAEQCPGAGQPITTRKGAKKSGGYYSHLKYPCVHCGRFFKKNTEGNVFPRHVAKTAAQRKAEAAKVNKAKADMGLAQGFCAGCSQMKWMEKGDFLCGDCRNA